MSIFRLIRELNFEYSMRQNVNQIKINCFQTVLRTVCVELNIPGKKTFKISCNSVSINKKLTNKNVSLSGYMEL